MNATDFILKKLQSFLGQFKTAKARYEYDELAKVHFIEITPQSVYDSLDFCEWENRIYDDFIRKYPFENICFISDDALVRLNNVTFEREGIEFAPYMIELDKVSLKIVANPVVCLGYDIVTEQTAEYPKYVFSNDDTESMVTERFDTTLKHAA